jgi:hypothetical protein
MPTSGVESMVIHSGSLLLLFAYLVTLITAIGFFVSVAMLVAGRFRTATKVAVASVAALAFYFLADTTISWVSPQMVIKLGDSYCWDLWCMGIDKVNASRRGQEMVYKIDVRFFSDANTVKTGTDDASVYLVDDRGHRFPLVYDPAVIPINTRLDPGQSLSTSLTFITPTDAAHLFLTGDAPLPDHIPLSWKFLRIYADLHFGYEKLSHKPTVLRVL